MANTVIGSSIVIDGEISGDEDLVIQGTVKGKISLAAYVAAIPLAFVARWAAIGLYVFVALLWLVPDKRIESQLER